MPTCPCQIGNAIGKALSNLREAQRLNCKDPEQSSPATLKSRTVKHANAIYNEARWLYLLTFQLENGEELTLQTDEKTYGNWKEGTKGEVIWQNDTLCQFLPKE